jgi:hypothetical protein
MRRPPDAAVRPSPYARSSTFARLKKHGIQGDGQMVMLEKNIPGGCFVPSEVDFGKNKVKFRLPTSAQVHENRRLPTAGQNFINL